MEPIAETGMAITVVHRTQPPVQYTGEISASRRSAVAVRFEVAPNLDTTEEMLLIIGSAGARSMATGRFVASQGNVVAFTLLTSWQQLDLRKSPRRALDGMVEVRSVLGQSRQDGYITDISTDGIAVVVATKPGGNAVELKISRNGFTSHLLCRIASVNGRGGYDAAPELPGDLPGAAGFRPPTGGKRRGGRRAVRGVVAARRLA